MARTLLEICCGSLDDALGAAAGGADRVELCAGLFLGGLTPSIGTLVEAGLRLRLPFMAMVRPRGGGFCYTAAEFATMERDVEMALEAGAGGVVLGVLKEDGAVDAKRTRALLRRAGAAQTVFHRAFDVTPDPFAALDALADLGVTRVLTSGQKDSAPEGAALIAELIARGGDRIEILPGGGIAPWNVAELVRRTGATQVHLTAWRTALDTSTRGRPGVTFGGALRPPEDRYDVTDPGTVKAVRRSLES